MTARHVDSGVSLEGSYYYPSAAIISIYTLFGRFSIVIAKIVSSTHNYWQKVIVN